MELQVIIPGMVTAPPVLVTYEESLLRSESSLEEVVNGELHIMPPATFPHGDLIQFVYGLLSAGLERDRYRLLWDVGYLIAESPRLRYRIPDLAVIEVERARRFRRERQPGDPFARFAPAAVLEILSPSNRKGGTEQLMRDYQDLGVGEIVFLDPQTFTATVNGEILTGNVLTVLGVGIDLQECWRVFEEGE